MRAWFAVDVLGLAYRVVLANDADAVPLLDGNEGVTDTNAGIIWIRENPGNPSRVRDTVLHEMLHAIFDATGGTHLLENTVKRGQSRQVEEQLVRMLAPALVVALRSCGLLGNLPKGL